MTWGAWPRKPQPAPQPIEEHDLPVEVCEHCHGEGWVPVHRYFRKTGHPARGVLHLAVHPPFRGFGWRCGCDTTATPRRGTRTEWLLERGTLPLCKYLRRRVELGDYLP